MIESILEAYRLKPSNFTVKPIGSGLINHTYVVNNLQKEPSFVLQQINTHVFKNPQAIADNISMIEEYLLKHDQDYLFVAPWATVNGEKMFRTKEGEYYRLFSYLWDTHTIDVVETGEQAYEAARQFGRFTKVLSGFDTSSLHITLQGFHDLSLRFAQFTEALKQASAQRKETAAGLIRFILDNTGIIDIYEKIKKDPGFTLRVTHHDTKISNVLFNKEGKAICVIDLDTVMPGYFISDVGDMFRTYLSPVSEEEKDFNKIGCRDDIFEAIAVGYLGEMKDVLSATEVMHFVYAGKFIIYMQAMRFLADYLNNDIYYKTSYEGQNLVRAGNQVELLKRLMEKETAYTQIVSKIIQR